MKLSEKDVERITKKMLVDHDKKVKESKYNPDNIDEVIDNTKEENKNIITFFGNGLI